MNMDVLPTGGGTVALLGTAGIDTFNRGNKFFELSNHLGNVLVTVSDRKLGQSPVNNLYTSFTADVVSATDYAPFGMQMVGRSFDAAGSTAYRYGFNGKENDNEVKGEGNQQDYGMRIYDPRLGKFLSVDPLTKSYPFYTPYQYAGNTPMQATDKDGGEPDFVLWRVALWVVKAKLTNAGDEFKKDIADHVQSSNNNYGRFDNARDISEQVRENQIKAFESKAKIVGTFAKGTAVSSAVIATPYVVAAGAVVLPELFAVSGIAQLNISGSYLAQKTVSAFINAAGQQVASGKVDWADVALQYIPGKGAFSKLILGAVEATVDYSDGKFETVFNGEKTVKEAAIDGLAIAFTNKMFGRFNKALEKAFEAKGLKGDKLRNAMNVLIKSQTEFLMEAIETAISEKAKEKQKSKK